MAVSGDKAIELTIATVSSKKALLNNEDRYNENSGGDGGGGNHLDSINSAQKMSEDQIARIDQKIN